MASTLTITISRSDGDPARWPKPLSYECLPLDHPTSIKWRQVIGKALAKHTQSTGEDVILAEWPVGYNLYYNSRMAPQNSTKVIRRDTYFYGGPFTFRTPAEFIPHAIYLHTTSTDNRDQCGCRYCSRRPQKQVSKQLQTNGLLYRAASIALTAGSRPKKERTRTAAFPSSTSEMNLVAEPSRPVKTEGVQLENIKAEDTKPQSPPASFIQPSQPPSHAFVPFTPQRSAASVSNPSLKFDMHPSPISPALTPQPNSSVGVYRSSEQVLSKSTYPLAPIVLSSSVKSKTELGQTSEVLPNVPPPPTSAIHLPSQPIMLNPPPAGHSDVSATTAAYPSTSNHQPHFAHPPPLVFRGHDSLPTTITPTDLHSIMPASTSYQKPPPPIPSTASVQLKNHVAAFPPTFASTSTPHCMPMQTWGMFDVTCYPRVDKPVSASHNPSFYKGDLVWVVLNAPLAGLHGKSDAIRFWPGIIESELSFSGKFQVDLFKVGVYTTEKGHVIPYTMVPVSDALNASIGRFMTGSFPVEHKYLLSSDPHSLLPNTTWEHTMRTFIQASHMASVISKHWGVVFDSDEGPSPKPVTSMWWGPEKLTPGDVVRLNIPRKQLASSARVVVPSGPGPTVYQALSLGPSRMLEQLGAAERVVLMRIQHFPTIMVQGTVHHLLAGDLFEVADKDWDNNPNPVSLGAMPRPPSGYAFRAILAPGFEAHIHSSFIRGRYYPSLGPNESMMLLSMPLSSTSRAIELKALSLPTEIWIPCIYSSNREQIVKRAGVEASDMLKQGQIPGLIMS